MHPPVPCGPARVAAGLALFLWAVSSTATTVTGQSSPGTEAADSTYFTVYHAAPRDTVSAAVYDGFKQFALNCARCHGDFGVGTSFAPALTESVKPAGTIPTRELFIQTVCAGRMDKGMPAWCAIGLDIGAMQQIHEYLLERSTGKVGQGRPALGAQ